MKNPWVKLWRNVLNDEKVSFIIRRYGHDCLTFWIGLLTKCEDGTLEMDEEIFADLCLLETKRYEEIRGVFIKRGLVELDDNGLMVVCNWDEYQVGESTKRVRRFRDIHRNADETPCNADETQMERSEGEGELEGELEGEGRNAPPATVTETIQEETQLAAQGGNISTLACTPEAIVNDWYQALSDLTGAHVAPPPKSTTYATTIVRVAETMDAARKLRAEYFANWRDLWFATARCDRNTPAARRAPDFDFRAYCLNIATMAARLSAKAPAPPPPRQATEPPPTPEERAAAASAFSAACKATSFARELETV
jgi:hypothetical protein